VSRDQETSLVAMNR